MLLPPIPQPDDPYAPPKSVKNARTLLWVQVVLNALSLVYALTIHIPEAAKSPDSDLTLIMNILLVLGTMLLALMVLSAALILKRLVWVYVVALAIQAFSLAIVVATFEAKSLLSLVLTGYIGLLLLRPETRLWFFPPKTA